MLKCDLGRSASESLLLRSRRYATIRSNEKKGRFHPELVKHDIYLPLKPIDSLLAPQDSTILSPRFKASVHRKFAATYLQTLGCRASKSNMNKIIKSIPARKCVFELGWRQRGWSQDYVRVQQDNVLHSPLDGSETDFILRSKTEAPHNRPAATSAGENHSLKSDFTSKRQADSVAPEVEKELSGYDEQLESMQLHRGLIDDTNTDSDRNMESLIDRELSFPINVSEEKVVQLFRLFCNQRKLRQQETKAICTPQTARVATLIAHYIFWRFLGPRLVQFLDRTDVNNIYEEVGNFYFLIREVLRPSNARTSYKTVSGTLDNSPLAIQAIHFVTTKLFQYQYPVWYHSDTSNSVMADMNRAIDDLIDPSAIFEEHKTVQQNNNFERFGPKSNSSLDDFLPTKQHRSSHLLAPLYFSNSVFLRQTLRKPSSASSRCFRTQKEAYRARGKPHLTTSISKPDISSGELDTRTDNILLKVAARTFQRQFDARRRRKPIALRKRVRHGFRRATRQTSEPKPSPDVRRTSHDQDFLQRMRGRTRSARRRRSDPRTALGSRLEIGVPKNGDGNHLSVRPEIGREKTETGRTKTETGSLSRSRSAGALRLRTTKQRVGSAGSKCAELENL